MTSIFENEKANSEVFHLSEEETKHYLTPFAFKMDSSLFGLPLASPTKRGIAILVDLALIALISDVSGVFLAFAIAVTLYYLANNNRDPISDNKRGHKRRAIMRFIAACILFIVLLDTLPPLLKYVSGEEKESQVQLDDKSLSLVESLTLGALTLSTMQAIDDSHCQTFSCWENQLNLVAIKMASISDEGDINLSPTQLDDLVRAIVKKVDLPIHEQTQIISSMHESYTKELIKLAAEQESNGADNPITLPSVVEQNTPSSTAQKKEAALQEDKSNKPVYSIIKWAKGIIEDLGLGFGWATFYFTAFTSLGQGQTLGKKITGIKVLQLDGTPLSLWDSFGRYGGYGAGLATGLLGFIQIYWDPNKQAIHDKISSTVVIDLRAARLNKSAHEQTTTL